MNNSELVISKIQAGRTTEDVTVLLYMNEVFSTKAECRKYVLEIVESNGLVQAKKVPMSEQLKAWFHAQPEPLKVTKKQLEDQIKFIGMSGGSVAWYVRVYMEVISISTTLLDEAAKKPTAKKPTAKKPTAKKPTAKKPTAKKTLADTKKESEAFASAMKGNK